jgi:hypothetical protein
MVVKEYRKEGRTQKRQARIEVPRQNAILGDTAALHHHTSNYAYI